MDDKGEQQQESAVFSRVERENATVRTVNVSNLAFQTAESDLSKAFAKCGQIEEIRLVRTPEGRSRGFAFIQFKEGSAVNNAIETMNQKLLNNRKISVSKAGNSAPVYESSTLFISGLPPTVTEISLSDIFSKAGVIKQIRLIKKGGTGPPKGIAYIDFIDQESLQKGLELNQTEFEGRKISVTRSLPPLKGSSKSIRTAPLSESPSNSTTQTQVEDPTKRKAKLALVPRALQNKK